MKLSKMQQKMVIDIMSGELLGYINDLDFDLRSYHIRCFEVKQKKGCMEKLCPWLFKVNTIRVDVDQIESIGNDVILVRIRKK